jgi:hypothetical protein
MGTPIAGVLPIRVTIVASDGETAAGGGSADSFGSQQVVVYDQYGVPVPYGTGTAVIGDVADAAVDTSAPVRIAGRAKAGLSGETLVNTDRRKDINVGRDGSVFVRSIPLEDIIDGFATDTIGASTAVIPAYAAGKQYLMRAIFGNEHATTTGFIVLKSGTTARTNRLAVPPGGAIYTFEPPLKPNATNESWNFHPGTAVTTLSCLLLGFKTQI